MWSKITISTIVALSISLFIAVKSCQSNRDKAVYNKAVLDSTTAVFKDFKNRSGLQVAEQKPAEFPDKKTVKSASAKAFNLSRAEESKIREVEAFVQADQEVTITGDSIKSVANLPDTLAGGQWRFELKRPHYYISGNYNKEMLWLDSLKIYNTISFRLAKKRTGIFKSEQVIQVNNSNPFINTAGMHSLTIKQKPTSWNKWVKPVLFTAAGLAIGRVLK